MDLTQDMDTKNSKVTKENTRKRKRRNDDFDLDNVEAYFLAPVCAEGVVCFFSLCILFQDHMKQTNWSIFYLIFRLLVRQWFIGASGAVTPTRRAQAHKPISINIAMAIYTKCHALIALMRSPQVQNCLSQQKRSKPKIRKKKNVQWLNLSRPAPTTQRSWTS